jgi:hypothetical protein
MNVTSAFENVCGAGKPLQVIDELLVADLLVAARSVAAKLGELGPVANE